MSEKELAHSHSEKRNPDTDKTRLHILLILGAGFVLRVGWLLYAQPAPVSDFRQYKTLAENLWEKHYFGLSKPTALRMPGYPFFLAGCMVVSRSDLWLGFINICLSVFICIEVYLLTRRLLHRKAAIWACLLCGLNPAFVLYSPVLASEHLFSVLVLGSLLMAWPTRGRGVFRIGLAGLLLGLGTLTRGSGLFYAPIVLGLTVWPANSDKEAQWGLRLGRAALVLFALASCLAPWYVRNRVVIGPGAGLSTIAGSNFYYAHNSFKYGYHSLPADKFGGLDNEVEIQNLAYRLGWEHLKAKPASALESVIRGTVKLYAPSVYGIHWSTRIGKDPEKIWITKPLPGRLALKVLSIAVYGLLLAGVLLAPVTRREWTRLNVFVIAGMIMGNWLGYAVIFIGTPRYHYLPEAFFCIITGAVLARLAGGDDMPRRKPE